VIIERREGLEEVIRLNRCLEAAKIDDLQP
jgi:hypothetical protein